jgi:hypothetical protein
MTGHSTLSKSSKSESNPAARGEAEERACCQPDERGSQTAAGGICCPPEQHPAGKAAVEPEKRRLDVEFLYLDLSLCGRCRGTDAALEEAVAEVSPILETTGVEAQVKKIHVETEAQARNLAFVISPTIRINGRDIQPEIEESLCKDCGDLYGGSCDCRVWRYRGKTYTTPPKALIVEALLRALYGVAGAAPKTAEHRHEVPDNLKRFFARLGS